MLNILPAGCATFLLLSYFLSKIGLLFAIVSFVLQKPLGRTNSNLYVAVPPAPAENDYVIQSAKPPTKAIVRERFKHPRITELMEVH